MKWTEFVVDREDVERMNSPTTSSAEKTAAISAHRI